MSEQNKKMNDSSPLENEILLLISEMVKKIEYLDSLNNLEPTNSVKGEFYQGHLIELNEQSYEYLCEITVHCPASPPEIVSIEPAPKEYALRLAKTYIDGRIATSCNEFNQILKTFKELRKIESKREENKNKSAKLREQRHLLSCKIKNFQKNLKNSSIAYVVFGLFTLGLIPITIKLFNPDYSLSLFNLGFIVGICSGVASSFINVMYALRPLSNDLKKIVIIDEMEDLHEKYK